MNEAEHPPTSRNDATAVRSTIELEVPADIIGKWQSIVDTMAELVNVPAGLIMRVSHGRITVLVSSESSGNPYHLGESDTLAESGLYCEAVIASGTPLLVQNALTSSTWANNPDVKRNMISYLGFPILWPDRQPFGTICVLDDKSNSYTAISEKLIRQFRDVIEHHLHLMFVGAERDAQAGVDRQHYEDEVRLNDKRFIDLRSDLARASRSLAISEFAASAFDKISQPLTAIVASAKTGLRWLERDEPNIIEARDAIVEVASDARRAAEVIRSLRSLMAQRHFSPEKIDMNEAVRDVLALHRTDFDQHGITVQLRLHCGNSRVMGNRLQLQQVVSNLLRNSVDALASQDHGVRVIQVTSADGPDDDFLVSIEDSGRGMTSEVSAKMFEPLFTTKVDGVGMGLAVCRSVVDAHGGKLWATPGSHGAKIELSLPTTQQ